MNMWLSIVIGVSSSVWLTWLTIRVASRQKVGADEADGVQKMHNHWVPRLGGIPMFASFTATILSLAWLTQDDVDLTARLIVCLLPAFAIGLVEDITRKAGVAPRLVFTMVAAALGWWLLEGRLTRLDIPGVDLLLSQYWPLAFGLTLFAAGGVAHAVNIIDGFNGLSGFFTAAALTAIGSVAWQVGDLFVMRAAFIGAASMVGFFVWNYPHGKIFLGDAGAYCIGFLIAELSMLLVYRNPAVSAWFPMLVMIYPVWETIFSMARRAAGGLARIGQPDALHLHQLIYKRVVKRYIGSNHPNGKVMRNAMTSPYLWLLSLCAIVPALVFWRQSHLLAMLCALFAASYVFIYWRIVSFGLPRWLVVRPMAKQQR